MLTVIKSKSTGKIAFRSAVCCAGMFLLVLTSLVWFLWLEMLTEALLTPFYCCDLVAPPSLGKWQQTLNDFFAAFPGRTLPAILFFLASGLVFWLRLKRAEDRTWLPLVFFGAYVLLLMVSVVATVLSWRLSNTIVGPRIGGIDAGYHRTWYGLVTHLTLWLLFFMALAKVHLPGDRSRRSSAL